MNSRHVRGALVALPSVPLMILWVVTAAIATLCQRACEGMERFARGSEGSSQ